MVIGYNDLRITINDNAEGLMKAILKNKQGMALVIAIMVMVILLSITGAGLLFSGLNLKTTSNLKTGSAALQVADAGIQHALAVIPNGTNFPYGSGANVVSTTVFPISTSGYSYVVTATNNPPTSSSTSTAILTSTANGPDGSKRVVKGYIGRSSMWIPPGAIYAPGGTNSDFRTSDNFFITGNDTNYIDNDPVGSAGYGRADATGAGTQSSILGLAGGSQTVVTEFLDSLTSNERLRVQGKDYNGSTSPATPSVGIPSTTLNLSQLATDLVNQITSNACPPKCLNGLHWNPGDCPSSNPCRLGTDSAPQITYIKEGQEHIHFDGYVYGSGILIVEGKAHLYQNFEFHGIVISLSSGVGGEEENYKLKMKDNARIFGSLLMGPNDDNLEFEVKNNAAVYYSKQGLDKAASVGPCCLPKPAKLIAWHEVMQ